MLIKLTPIYCSLLWIPDVCDVMTDMGWDGRERGGGKVSEEYFHRLASPDREAERK